MKFFAAAVALMCCPLFAAAQPARCPYDADGDGRVDIDDLYHLTQNPADINGDGVADAGDTACLEAYLRCVEVLDMSFRPGEAAADGNVPSLVYRESDAGGGLTQTLSVVRMPSPDGIGCISQRWTTTLLGTRPGLAGPVEIRLDRDGFLWQGLFADAVTTSPGSTRMSGMLTCDGSAIELVEVMPGGTVGSADGLRALVLLDGQSVTDQAVAKGVADAAGRDIGGGLIDTYTDINGVVTLPTRSMLVLFELGGTSPSDPAFAFDDAAVLVEVGCGAVDDAAPQLVVLRDSIGPDSSMTDFNNFYQTTSIGSGNNLTAFEVSSDTDITLTEFSAVVVGFGFTVNWAAYDWELRVWPSFAAAQADVGCAQPSCEKITFDNPTVGPTDFGTTDVAPFGNRVTKLVQFYFSSGGIQIEAGGSCFIGFRVFSPGGAAGAAALLESDEPGIMTDMKHQGSTWSFTSYDPRNFEYGRLGVRLIGVTD